VSTQAEHQRGVCVPEIAEAHPRNDRLFPLSPLLAAGLVRCDLGLGWPTINLLEHGQNIGGRRQAESFESVHDGPPVMKMAVRRASRRVRAAIHDSWEKRAQGRGSYMNLESSAVRPQQIASTSQASAAGESSSLRLTPQPSTTRLNSGSGRETSSFGAIDPHKTDRRRRRMP